MEEDKKDVESHISKYEDCKYFIARNHETTLFQMFYAQYLESYGSIEGQKKAMDKIREYEAQYWSEIKEKT